MPQQQPQPQADASGFPMSAAQKMATEQMANQQAPFGWLIGLIQHITGGGQPAQPGQPAPAPGQQPQQKSGASKPLGKQSDAGAGSGVGGQIDPNQVPELASIMQPNAATALGLMPQTQGSFGWLLQMLQQQQMQQQQAQGAGLVQLVSQLMGGGGQAAGGAGAGAAGAGASGGSGAAAGGGASAVPPA